LFPNSRLFLPSSFRDKFNRVIFRFFRIRPQLSWLPPLLTSFFYRSTPIMTPSHPVSTLPFTLFLFPLSAFPFFRIRMVRDFPIFSRQGSPMPRLMAILPPFVSLNFALYADYSTSEDFVERIFLAFQNQNGMDPSYLLPFPLPSYALLWGVSIFPRPTKNNQPPTPLNDTPLTIPIQCPKRPSPNFRMLSSFLPNTLVACPSLNPLTNYSCLCPPLGYTNSLPSRRTIFLSPPFLVPFLRHFFCLVRPRPSTHSTAKSLRPFYLPPLHSHKLYRNVVNYARMSVNFLTCT